MAQHIILGMTRGVSAVLVKRAGKGRQAGEWIVGPLKDGRRSRGHGGVT